MGGGPLEHTEMINILIKNLLAGKNQQPQENEERKSRVDEVADEI